MSKAGTVQLLWRWGRTSRADPLGLPTIAAFLKERVGRSVYEPPSDPEIELITAIVERAPTEQKNYLIMWYCRRDSFRRIAALMGVSKSSVRSKLDEAEWYVHTEIELIVDVPRGTINEARYARP